MRGIEDFQVATIEGNGIESDIDIRFIGEGDDDRVQLRTRMIVQFDPETTALDYGPVVSQAFDPAWIATFIMWRIWAALGFVPDYLPSVPVYWVETWIDGYWNEVLEDWTIPHADRVRLTRIASEAKTSVGLWLAEARETDSARLRLPGLPRTREKPPSVD